jgi:NADH-quinone oxidoreductase subunit M
MAHTEAPASGSVILAAILLKLGVFGFIRYSIGLLGEINIYLSPIIITLSLISIIYCSYIIFRLLDIKKIIAYSSIIHMNYLMIGIYIFDLHSIIGSYYTVISHGFVSSGLFILIGIIYRRYHTRNILYIKGLSNILPIFSVIYFIFIISNMSIPLTSSFPGELLILLGTYKGSIIISIIMLLLLLLSTGYNILLLNKVIYGSISIYIKKYIDLTLNEVLTLIPLIIFNFLLGILTNPLIDISILPFTFII